MSTYIYGAYLVIKKGDLKIYHGNTLTYNNTSKN